MSAQDSAENDVLVLTEATVARALRPHIGNGWTGSEVRCCGQWRTLGEHAEHMARALLATRVIPPGEPR